MTEVITIVNIENYNAEIINGNLILTPKVVYVNEINFEAPLLKRRFTILECEINNQKTHNVKLIEILTFIYTQMSTNKILQQTLLDFKLEKITDGKDGYRWNETVKMSIKTSSHILCLRELVNMIKFNKYTLKIKIKLSDDNIIYLKM